MEIRDIQASPSLVSKQFDDVGPSSRHSSEHVQIEEKPRIEKNIWDKVRHGHVPTAMRLRSLLLFISSTIMSYLESVTGTVPYHNSPSEIIARIVAKFINGGQEDNRKDRTDTLLDALFAKLPIADPNGMHYHKVYLSLCPMITSVNWTRVTFIRPHAKLCYRSLTHVLHVCFDQVGVLNRSEADQLVLAIYVTSIWCSIIKEHPELAVSIGNQNEEESEDFETHMKTWIFHPLFENFARVLVSSCCQIMDIADKEGYVLEKKASGTDSTSPRGPPEIESNGERDVQRPVSLTGAPQTILDPASQGSTPTVAMSIHPSWQAPGQFPVYEPDSYMLQYFPGMFMNQHTFAPVSYAPLTQESTLSAQFPGAQKRKATEQPQQLPSFQQLTDKLTKPRGKKGPRPGTGIADSAN